MRFSIRTVLIFGVLGVQIVTVTAILVSSYMTTQDALLKHARDIMLELSAQTIWRSQQFLDPVRGAADLTQRLANYAVLRTQNFAAMERYFFEQLRQYPWFSGLYFGATDGSFIYVKREEAAPDQPGAFLTKLITNTGQGRLVELVKRSGDFTETERAVDPDDVFDPRTRPWYKEAVSRKAILWTEPYIFFTSRLPGITAAGPIIDVNGKVHGAIGVDIEIAEISSFLRDLRIGKSGSAFILNRNGDVIAYPDSDRIKLPRSDPKDGLRFVKLGELDDPVARAAVAALKRPPDSLELDGPAFTTFRHGDTAYLGVFTPFFNTNWPWVMGIYVPENDFLGVIKGNALFNIYLAVGVTIVACVVSVLVWRTMARPLRALSGEAHALRGGNFNIQPTTRSVYEEIDETAFAFREMAASLREHERETLRLRDLQSNLIESIRKSSLGQFASAVSHELNQPLTAIATYLQIIGRVLDSHDEGRIERVADAVGKARQQADRAGIVLQGLRNMAESGETARSVEYIHQVVREAAALGLTDTAAKGVELRDTLEPPLPPVEINRVQVQQVVLNLIRNACEAMARSQERVLTIGAKDVGDGMVQVSVGDTGEGLDAEVAGRLFEPMVSSKPDGMGVGLSISRSIIESHGGQLSAEEAPDGGMTFRFTVPKAAAREAEDGRHA